MGETPDLSMFFNMFSNSQKEDSNETLDISKLLALMSDGSKIGVEKDDNVESPNMPDMETIMKIAGAINSVNRPSPSKALLYSLKPFLNEHRKGKVDTYVKLLGMTSVLDILKSEKGEKNE